MGELGPAKGSTYKMNQLENTLQHLITDMQGSDKAARAKAVYDFLTNERGIPPNVQVTRDMGDAGNVTYKDLQDFIDNWLLPHIDVDLDASQENEVRADAQPIDITSLEFQAMDVMEQRRFVVEWAQNNLNIGDASGLDMVDAELSAAMVNHLAALMTEFSVFRGIRSIEYRPNSTGLFAVDWNRGILIIGKGGDLVALQKKMFAEMIKSGESGVASIALNHFGDIQPFINPITGEIVNKPELERIVEYIMDHEFAHMIQKAMYQARNSSTEGHLFEELKAFNAVWDGMTKNQQQALSVYASATYDADVDTELKFAEGFAESFAFYRMFKRTGTMPKVTIDGVEVDAMPAELVAYFDALMPQIQGNSNTSETNIDNSQNLDQSVLDADADLRDIGGENHEATISNVVGRLNDPRLEGQLRLALQANVELMNLLDSDPNLVLAWEIMSSSKSFAESEADLRVVADFIAGTSNSVEFVNFIRDTFANKNEAKRRKFLDNELSVVHDGSVYGDVAAHELVQVKSLMKRIGGQSAFFGNSETGIEGFIFVNGKAVPFSLKRLTTPTAKNVFRTLRRNIGKITDNIADFMGLVKTENNANTIIVIDATEVSSADLLAWMEQNDNALPEVGIHETIIIIGSDGVEIVINQFNDVN
jgi:hypothetical protein